MKFTEEQAYAIACEYWDYEPGKIDELTSYEMFVTSGGLSETTDGTACYIFNLSWMVTEENTSHLSTLDTLQISASTGDIL